MILSICRKDSVFPAVMMALILRTVFALLALPATARPVKAMFAVLARMVSH
jgi:hypothetical protein